MKKFLTSHNLSDSLLMGYYGGGNYGDELLLEVLMNMLSQQHAKNVKIFYKDPAEYSVYHKDFGYQLVDRSQLFQVLRTVIKSKRIVIGGGGLWGRDVNRNVLLFSLLLFLSRYILRKEVNLIGVGYYHSTSRMGHVSAWLATKAASTIIARDKESQKLFSKYKKDTEQDNDIAFLLPDIDRTRYRNDVQKLQKELKLPNNEKFVFVTLRRYGHGGLTHYDNLVRTLIADNPHTTFVVALLEAPDLFPEGDSFLQDIAKTYTNVRRMNEGVNPITLFGFFIANQKRMLLIAPQFHAILSAHLAQVPFLPIAYDNKVKELFRIIGCKRTIEIPNGVKSEDLQSFVTTHTKKGAA